MFNAYVKQQAFILYDIQFFRVMISLTCQNFYWAQYITEFCNSSSCNIFSNPCKIFFQGWMNLARRNTVKWTLLLSQFSIRKSISSTTCFLYNNLTLTWLYSRINDLTYMTWHDVLSRHGDNEQLWFSLNLYWISPFNIGIKFAGTLYSSIFLCNNYLYKILDFPWDDMLSRHAICLNSVRINMHRDPPPGASGF